MEGKRYDSRALMRDHQLTDSVQPLIFGSAAITLALICEAILNAKNPNGAREGLSIGGVFFIFLVTCVSNDFC